MATVKRLDLKLAHIEQGNYKPSDFIIADAQGCRHGNGS